MFVAATVENVTVVQSLGYSVLGILIVFAVLVFLMVIIYIMTAIMRKSAKKPALEAGPASPDVQPLPPRESVATAPALPDESVESSAPIATAATVQLSQLTTTDETPVSNFAKEPDVGEVRKFMITLNGEEYEVEAEVGEAINTSETRREQ